MQLKKFIKMDEGLVAIDDISSVYLKDLEKDYKIMVTTKTGEKFIATDLNAIECVMQIRPGALEGKRLKWAKRVWYVHNLVGHPLMQVLAMFGLYAQAMWVHDVTVPKPIGFKSKG